MDADGALALLADVDDLYVARGKKTLHFDLKSDRPADEEILAVILGRSGTLRAPAIRTGSTFLVGYNDSLLEARLG